MVHLSHRVTAAGILAIATASLSVACVDPSDQGDSTIAIEEAQDPAIRFDAQAGSGSSATTRIAELHLESGHRIVFSHVINDGLPDGWGIDAVEAGDHGEVSLLGAVLADGGTMLEAFLTLAPESTPPLELFDDHDAQTEARGGAIADIRDFSYLTEREPVSRASACRSYTAFKATVNDLGQLKKSKSDIGTFSISRNESANPIKFGLACNSTRQPGSSNDQITVQFCLNSSCDSGWQLNDAAYKLKYFPAGSTGTHQVKAKSPYPDAFRAYLALGHDS